MLVGRSGCLPTCHASQTASTPASRLPARQACTSADVFRRVTHTRA